MDGFMHPRIAFRRAKVQERHELRDQFEQTSRRVNTYSRSGMALVFLGGVSGFNPWLLGAGMACFGFMAVESFFGIRFTFQHGVPPAPNTKPAEVLSLPVRPAQPAGPATQ